MLFFAFPFTFVSIIVVIIIVNVVKNINKTGNSQSNNPKPMFSNFNIEENTEKQTPEKQEKIVCSYCGNEVEAGKKKCDSCGARVDK